MRAEDPFYRPILKEISPEGSISKIKQRPVEDTIAWTGENGSSDASVALNDDDRVHSIDFATILIDPMRKETMEDAERVAKRLLHEDESESNKEQFYRRAKFVFVSF